MDPENKIVHLIDMLVRPVIHFIQGEQPHPSEPAPPAEQMIPRDPQHQLDVIRHMGWADEEEIMRLAATMPMFPETDRLIARVAVPHFEDRDGFTGFQVTLREIMRLVGIANKPKTAHYEYALPAQLGDLNLKHYTPLGGVGYEPGIRWEIIELDSDIDGIPSVMRSGAASPSLGVYAAALYYPLWVRNLGRKGAPNVFAPGVNRVINDGGVEKDFTTTLQWDANMQAPGFDCHLADQSLDGFAVPRYYSC